jgi:hypothetical protein
MMDDADRRPGRRDNLGTEVSTGSDVRPVGYRSPPAEHRFRKGKSGNPSGRPRTKKPHVELPKGNHSPSERLGNQLLLEEAYRPVIVREGDKVIELPAIQAVFRAMNVAAMKGNRLTQKMVAEMVAGVEEEHRKLQQSYFEAMVSYKIDCEKEIARCRRNGLPEPTLLPHPDDVVINYRNGTVRIDGPLSPEDKVKWDSMLARRAEAQEEVSYCATEYNKTRSPRMKEILLQNWIFEQYIFDTINDAMPERLKAKLENRTYVDGASREGKALKQVAKWSKRNRSI